MSSENADLQSYAVLRFWFICKGKTSPQSNHAVVACFALVLGGNEGFFSENDYSMRKNAEIIWRTRKKISNSPSKTN